MKYPGYRAAIDWIAANDEAGTDLSEEECGSLVTACMVAELFDVDQDKVGRDVYLARERNHKAYIADREAK